MSIRNNSVDGVIDFLRENKLYAPDIDMGEYCDKFLSEMRRGLAGQAGSLQMIPTYIEVDQEVPVNSPVMAIDAGGSSLRIAVIEFDVARQPRFLHFSRHQMPGLNGEIGKAEFFNTIGGYLNDLFESSLNIGFSIAYPTEILPNKDGRLIRFCKEVRAPEVKGEMFGENLKRAMTPLSGGEPKHIVILNDTVATLLAGRSTAQNTAHDSYIGFILGTGTNCCYTESNRNITKHTDLDISGDQIVNVESGSFGLGPRGPLDVLLDEGSVDPGFYTYEKMLSGGYLGPLGLLALKTAATQYKLFSDETVEALEKMELLFAEDINAFLRDSGDAQSPMTRLYRANEQDRDNAGRILDAIVDRAAKLSAINVAAAALKSGKGKTAEVPVAVTVDGTTFFQMKSLRDRVTDYLDEFLVEQHGTHYEILSVEEGTIIGAAIAGLTN
jgi:hexokinase